MLPGDFQVILVVWIFPILSEHEISIHCDHVYAFSISDLQLVFYSFSMTSVSFLTFLTLSLQSSMSTRTWLCPNSESKSQIKTGYRMDVPFSTSSFLHGWILEPTTVPDECECAIYKRIHRLDFGIIICDEQMLNSCIFCSRIVNLSVVLWI